MNAGKSSCGGLEHFYSLFIFNKLGQAHVRWGGGRKAYGWPCSCTPTQVAVLCLAALEGGVGAERSHLNITILRLGPGWKSS